MQAGIPPLHKSNIPGSAALPDELPAWLRSAIGPQLEGYDWDRNRHLVGKLLHQLLPMEKLVPEIYSPWRPVVKESLIFIGENLSLSRLGPKIIEQVSMPLDAPLEKRVSAFISQMPVLQKLGQTIARNRNLSPEFRSELIQLENEICDVSPEQTAAEIKRQLGSRLDKYDVEIEEVIHAEASVSAVIRFTWIDPVEYVRRKGVFKVLKPYIPEYFTEEIELMLGLARHLNKIKCSHDLADMDFYGIFAEIRQLLEREVDFINEQANLEDAYCRFRGIDFVGIPSLVPELSTSRVTAMTFSRGIKVTDTKRNIHGLAEKIVEALVAIPLFSTDKEAVFHADPHAGNLLFDQGSGKIIIFDWALTERMNLEHRRRIVMLLSSMALRDEKLIYSSILGLIHGDLNKNKYVLVRSVVGKFISELLPFTSPGYKQTLALLDELVFSGIRFAAPLLIFRKVLLTMDGILHDMNVNIPVDQILAGYLLRKNTLTSLYTGILIPVSHTYSLPVSIPDSLDLMWSAQSLGFRMGIQSRDRFLRIFHPRINPIT